MAAHDIETNGKYKGKDLDYTKLFMSGFTFGNDLHAVVHL